MINKFFIFLFFLLFLITSTNSKIYAVPDQLIPDFANRAVRCEGGDDYCSPGRTLVTEKYGMVPNIAKENLCGGGQIALCNYDQDGIFDATNVRSCFCLKLEKDEVAPQVEEVSTCACQYNRVVVNQCEVGFIATCASRTDQPACACYTPEVAAVEGRKDTSFFCDTVAGLDTGVESALGCIPMDMNKFAAWFLQFIFGIAGAIAFLLMVYGFILIATSSGDEKKVQGARETVTSAITGLLVSIFALFIFRLIAVNILHIPGLN